MEKMIEQFQEGLKNLQLMTAGLKNQMKPLFERCRVAHTAEIETHKLEKFVDWFPAELSPKYWCRKCVRGKYCDYGSRQGMACVVYWLGQCEVPEIKERYLRLMEACVDGNGEFRITSEVVDVADFEDLLCLAHLFEVNIVALPEVNCLYLRLALRRLIDETPLTDDQNEFILSEMDGTELSVVR